MESILKTEALTRAFKSGQDTIYALKNISIDIMPNKLTILRGRSGSGKTTLINLLGAMDLPTSGKIYFKDKDITQITESDRDKLRRYKIGFVFQSGALFSHLNAYENVEFGLRLTNYNIKERKERAEECLKIVDLLKRKEHFPHELSGGEMQRVAIARAIAHKPEIIFADEPTAALDTNMSLQVVKIFKDLILKEKLTIVMTTHDPSMIDIADKVYTLQDGEITE